MHMAEYFFETKKLTVGYDGVPLIQLCKPRLTTVWQDTTTIGQEAARQLVRLIEHPGDVKPGVIPVPCRLIRGDSMRQVAASDFVLQSL